MFMRFHCNLLINFCHFFRSLNLVIFLAQLLPKHIDTTYLVNATPPAIIAISLINFADVFVKV